MDSLPNELLVHILSFLPERCLTNCRSVSRNWQKACEEAICRKPIVNVVIVCPGGKAFIKDVDNVLVTDDRSSESLLSFLRHVRKASLTFTRLKDADVEARKQRVMIGFAESFVRNNCESLQSLSINNNMYVRTPVRLPQMSSLTMFSMDHLDVVTLRNVVDSCPAIESLTFRKIEAPEVEAGDRSNVFALMMAVGSALANPKSPLNSLPVGFKKLWRKYDYYPALDFKMLSSGAAMATIEEMPVVMLPEVFPTSVSLPKLRKAAYYADDDSDDLDSLPLFLSAAPNIQEMLFETAVTGDEDELSRFWNRVFSRLKNLVTLRLQGRVSTGLYSAIAANCSKLQNLHVRTYRANFYPSDILELTSLENLKRIDIITECVWDPLTPVREFAQQKPQVEIKLYIAVRRGHWVTRMNGMINALAGRCNEFVCDIGPIRRPYHTGSSVITITAAVAQ